MDKQEFYSMVGKIIGVKGGVKGAEIRKVIDTEKVYVNLLVEANEAQAKKLMSLAVNQTETS